MKNLKFFLIIFLIGIFSNSAAQSGTSNDSLNDSGLRFSIRGGYDIPSFGNNTPYIDYKGGLEAGASLDYYWKWIGLGVDFDYINNKPKSVYPTSNLFLGSNPVTDFTLTEDKITRIFYGIGPSFKYQRSNKAFWELKLRAGLASIKGGKTELIGSNPGIISPTLLNFHAGYDEKNVFSGKASLQYNHYLTRNFGFHIGAYYLQHFGAQELVDPTYSISSGFTPFMNGDGAQGGDFNFLEEKMQVREEPCDCEIHSVGAYAGIFFSFGQKKQAEKCPVCGKAHQPFCCATCGCDVTITARDKFTNETLDNTDVVLVDKNGNIVQSGKTNAYGVVVFKEVLPNDYTIKGKLYDVDLAENTISIKEFDDCKENGEAIQKDILYTDENFIINGKVVVCNTNMPINDVQVTLKNNMQGIQKTTNTDSKGAFIFHANQNVNYSIYGKKGSYMSQTETLLTKDYNRNNTLFIKLEICMEKVDCGNAIILKNILYDLDKDYIREDAKPELNRLVQFMNDNPDVKVELSSHTDSRASNSYNNDLSQRRANKAVDYLVSQGISRNRLIGKGYGETKLLNRCADGVSCSESEHQLNRRTEMKVICPE